MQVTHTYTTNNETKHTATYSIDGDNSIIKRMRKKWVSFFSATLSLFIRIVFYYYSKKRRKKNRETFFFSSSNFMVEIALDFIIIVLAFDI